MSEETKRKESLARLKATRKSHRGVVTRYINEVNEILQSTRIDEPQLEIIENLKQRLLLKSKALDTIDGEITELCELTEINKEIEESETITYKVTETINKIDRAVSAQERRNQRASREPSTASTASTTTVTTTRNRPKLPKLDLQKFNGDILKYKSFWDRFESAIDKNEDVPPIEKFNYLVYYLEGPAARIIDGLEISENNYETAKELIQKRFGRPQLIISSHMEELLKLKPCISEKANQLRYLYDKISVHLRGLESLGVKSDTNGATLVPVIMAKLPPEIRVQVARLTSKEIWSLKELSELLQQEVEAREISEGVKVNEERIQSSTIPRRPTIRNTAATLYSGNNDTKFNITCIYCGNAHYSASCENIKDINQRKNILKQKGRCFICLRAGHRARQCASNKLCRQCNHKHHQSICDQNKKSNEAVTTESSSSEDVIHATTSTSTPTSAGKSHILLQTARTMAYKDGDGNANGVPVRVMFDSGSQRSYITESLKRKLGLDQLKKETIHLNTFGNEKVSKNVCSLVKFYVQDKRGEKIELKAVSFPKICSPLPSRVDLADYPHLQNLELADPLDSTNNVETVDILVGADMYWDLIEGEIIREGPGPIAINSKFGWIVSGPVRISNIDTTCITNLILEVPGPDEGDNDPIVTQLKNFWETESVGIIDNHKTNVDKPFLENVTFDGTRYKVGLPWKKVEINPLPDDYDLSLNRLNSLYARLSKNPELLKQYDNIIAEQKNLGIIEEVPTNEQTKDYLNENNCHFIPHHGVCRQDRQTTKLRIVYDGSAKPPERDLSMNDYLDNGPNFIPPVFDILTRFRAKPVTVIADVEKAFLQISIDEKDRNSLRFLWYQNSTDGQEIELKQFRFCRLMFGLRPSPSILGFVINEHLKKFEDTEPEVVDSLKSQLFVDDFVGVVDTVEEGFNLYEKSKQIMNSGSFRLLKWNTNSPELLELIENDQNSEISNKNITDGVNEEDRTFVKETLGPNMISEDKTKTKILGLNWHVKNDEFYFEFDELIEFANKLPPTKRSVLRVTAKIFDPLGFLAPVTVNLKEMFQQLCTDKVNWDDELQGDMRKKFYSIVFDLNRLKDVKLPRCLFSKTQKVKAFEMHGFSDSSSKAYGACVYLVTQYYNDTFTVNLIASKSRIAPLKQQTIPRLELLGAHLLSKLMKGIQNSLENLMKTQMKCFYWVDSQVVLCWIKNERIWKQYIQNRVHEILKVSSRTDWNFCPGALNPADLPSRGLKANDLVKSDKWWHGPQFLSKDKANWPKQPEVFETKVALEELKRVTPDITHALSVQLPKEAKLINFEIFSSKSRLLRTVCWVLRFVDILKRRIRKSSNNETFENELSAAEIDRAETFVIKQVQTESFSEQRSYLLKNNPQSKPPKLVAEFGLHIDTEGIIRCKTRLKNAFVLDSSKTPILLPSKHRYTHLTISAVHAETGHNSIAYTLASCRERFWIIRGRQAVKQAIKRCVVCIRYYGKTFSTAPCYDLPKFRLDDEPPFSNTGLDFAGPLFVKNSDGSVSKSYICLYTCASTRAVHLELVNSLDTETFLRSFRRFAARRGLPKLIISDNAKTFKAASREIRNISRSAVIKNHFTKKGVSWRFIPERSPWFGSFYERMVGTVKSSIKKIIGKAMLNFDEMNTILIEIECIVNNRPISYVYDDSEGISFALTPSHLIYGRRIASKPTDGHYEIVSTAKNLTRKAKHHMRLLESFTKLWKRNYLLNLQEKPIKNGKLNKEIRIGDVVFLKDEKTRRTFWKLAKIENIFEGSDGFNRVATVKVLNNDKNPVTLRRSIKHLVPLELPREEDEEINQTKNSQSDGNEEEVSPENRERPRRTAKLIGELKRKNQIT